MTILFRSLALSFIAILLSSCSDEQGNGTTTIRELSGGSDGSGYTLTVSSTNGTVTKNPNKASYNAGDSVTLVAVPANGYKFSGWSGGITDANATTTVFIDSNLNITANFRSLGVPSAGMVTDTDGNVYQTVRIGNQVWTMENLRVTKYNDGSSIPLGTSTVTWGNDTTPMFCYYSNTTNADSIKKFGALYNWYAVDTKKLAPTGWHVPTDSEWEVMQNYLVMHGYNYDGTTDTSNNKIAMALAAQTDWYSYTGVGYPGNNLTMNNSSGFSALPGGYRYSGEFSFHGVDGIWWSATEENASGAWYRSLDYASDYLGRSYGYNSKSFGFSVRLMQD